MGSSKVLMKAAPYWGHFKVFKVRGGFLCGVCRKSYSAENQADFCVKGCMTRFVSHQADVLVRGVKTRFRCPYCYREYHDKNLATQCISNCGAVASGAHHNAQVAVGAVGLGSEAAPNKPTYLDEDDSHGLAAQSAPAGGGSGTSAVGAVGGPTSFADHAPPAGEEAPGKQQNIVVGDGEEGVIYREMNQKPFVRHNASYVCSACRTKFFTKAEVEACFEAHPIRDRLI